MILKNFKILIKTHRLIVVFFLFLQTSSFLSILSAYCQCNESYINNQEYIEQSTTFAIESKNCSFNVLEEFIQYLKFNSNKIGIKTVRVFIQTNRGFPVVYIPFGEEYTVGNGSNLTNSNTAEVILTPKQFYETNAKIGNTIDINGKNTTVVGIYNVDCYASINKVFFTSSAEISKVDVVFDHLPTKLQIESFNNIVNEQLPMCDVTNPPPRNIINEIAFNYEFLGSIVMLGLAILSLSFIYKYLLGERKYLFSIYRSCGCRIGKMFNMCFCEYAISFLLSLSIAFIIFEIFLKETLFTFSLSLYDYLIPVLISVFISFFIISIQIKIYLNESIITLIKGGE